MTAPQHTADPSRWYRIEPQPEYSPQIGALVEMMNYVRMTTLQDVEGLEADMLDTIPARFSNSIGMLLAHIAAIDRLYHILSFQGVDPYSTEEFQPHLGANTFGRRGERVAGRSLEELLSELERSRAATLTELAKRDDAWLSSVATGWNDFHPDHHWAWFHVMEDELNQRGQIRLVRKALTRQRAASEEAERPRPSE